MKTVILYNFYLILGFVHFASIVSSAPGPLSLVDLAKRKSFCLIKNLVKTDPSLALQKMRMLPPDFFVECIHSCCYEGFEAPQALSDCIKAFLHCDCLLQDPKYYSVLVARLSAMKRIAPEFLASHVLSSQDLPFLQSLLCNKMITTDFTFSDGQTLLHRATQASNISMIEVLLQLNFAINARDASKYTALHFAPSQEIAEILVRAGADIRARGDVRKDIPWQSASLAGRYAVADYLKGLLGQ